MVKVATLMHVGNRIPFHTVLPVHNRTDTLQTGTHTLKKRHDTFKLPYERLINDMSQNKVIRR